MKKVKKSTNTITNPSKGTKRTNTIALFSVISFAAIFGFSLSPFSTKLLQTKAFVNDVNKTEIGSFPLVEPTIKYGFIYDNYHVTEANIESNQFLGDILLKHHLNYATIDQLAKDARKTFDVRTLRVGKPYTILSKDTTQAADYFIYEPDAYRYVVFNLKDTKDIKIVEKEVTKVINTASGIVETSLWNTMIDNGLSYELTARMEDALAWSIDFYHISKNDKFKLVYEQEYIEGKPVGIGDVHAAYYKTKNNEYYAIYFENEKYDGFYDEEGRPMKKAFLKSPVKYSRISSRFNKRRFHPILKRVKPHLGTDYAAPRGTPIIAVADGVVTKRSYSRGNGKYVKIKHDKVYQTQYLHMNGFAKGVKVGTHVKQGQTIGYVGSTGLATGPHVCFRFWKNNKQVNHLRENLPPPLPMPKLDLPRYKELRDEMVAKLDAIPFYTAEELKAKKELREAQSDKDITMAE